jgi:hypothetical protein
MSGRSKGASAGGGARSSQTKSAGSNVRRGQAARGVERNDPGSAAGSIGAILDGMLAEIDANLDEVEQRTQRIAARYG